MAHTLPIYFSIEFEKIVCFASIHLSKKTKHIFMHQEKNIGIFDHLNNNNGILTISNTYQSYT